MAGTQATRRRVRAISRLASRPLHRSGKRRRAEDHALEVKWGIHPAGQKRPEWTEGEDRSTLVIMVSGRFRVDLSSDSVTLTRQGDYVTWGPGIDHSWQAESDSVVITVRWPSAPA